MLYWLSGGGVQMSLFKTNITAASPKGGGQTPLIEALVDTGSELTWLPADILARAGIEPLRRRTFQTATKEMIERPIGYAILRVGEFETIDEVVFAEPNDMSLLGVRTIEGFGVVVDNVGHRFVAQATLVV